MGLLDLLRTGRARRPDPDRVTLAVREAVLGLPDVTAAVDSQPVAYQHAQYGGGALHGVLEVADSASYLAVLRTAAATLRELLGDDAQRVTFHLVGRTPDRSTVTPQDLGLPPAPIGRELAERLGDSGPV